MSTFELHCSTCAQPGATSTNRREVQSLTDAHNGLLHRGQPVAVIRRARRFGARKAA